MKALLAIFLSFHLVGCGTLANQYAADRAPKDLKPQFGIVIVSTGAVESCAKHAAALYFQPLGSTYDAPASAGPNVNWAAYKSEYPDRRGALNVFALEAGAYQAFARPIDATRVGARIPKAEFSLKPGEILYLGEYFISTPCAASFIGSFRDQEKRDLDILRQRRPDLAAHPYSKVIPEFSGYLASPLDPIL